MASIIKQVSTSIAVALEASNNVIVAGSNVAVNIANVAETSVDTVSDAILIAKSHSSALLKETELDNNLKIQVIEDLSKDEEYMKVVKNAYRTAKLAELQDALDLEVERG